MNAKEKKKLTKIVVGTLTVAAVAVGTALLIKKLRKTQKPI